MFDHSIKVPRLYKTASKIARQVSEGKGSIKQLVYEGKHPNIKALYALVVHTFQRTDDIDNVLKKSKLLKKEPRFDPWLAKILITELLWGKKRLTGDSKPIKTILAYEQIFKAHMSDVPVNFRDLEQVDKPRYVRVNTLKMSTDDAIEGFRDEGWVLKRYPDNDYTGFLDALANLGAEEFMIDLHIPNLLIFPRKTQFYKHPAYKSGRIILQDKASCLPVHMLNPEPGSTILDMCAAPGMKTTQSASAMEDQGLIYSVEIGPKRFETLKKMIELSGATCVKSINRDVLTLTETNCPDVDYILVDPSCSGSGITDRVEVGQQRLDQDQARFDKLAAFQITTLRYALTRFSKAKKVVYSTCSVFPEENEDVVRQVLETCTTFKLVPADQFVNKTWLNFGSSEFGDIGKYCLYAKPEIDLTNGFFVAVFERLQEGETNQFLNHRLYAMRKQMGTNLGNSEKQLADDNQQTQVLVKKEKKKKTIEDDYETVVAESKKRIKEERDPSNQRQENGETSIVQVSGTLEEDCCPKKKKKKDKCKQEFEDTTFPMEDERKGEIVAETTGTNKKKKKIKVKIEAVEYNEQEKDSLETVMTIRKNKKKKKDKHKNALEEDEKDTIIPILEGGKGEGGEEEDTIGKSRKRKKDKCKSKDKDKEK